MRIVWIIAAFIIAVIVAGVAGTVASSVSVLAQLDAMGAPVPTGQAIQMVLGDIVGMAPLYLPIIAGGFLIAFLAGALLDWLVPGFRVLVFSVAGGVAVLVAITTMIFVFDGIIPIAGARSDVGFLAQGFAGLLGGCAFGLLRRA
ncbi:MAG: hypothetical protein GC199_10590 [Alphaproteobacteria bacterium]|nr:hypothetical protein [Alphaproteobacteria bacterium]